MTISDYLKSTRAVILTCLAGGFFFSVLLLLYGITPQVKSMTDEVVQNRRANTEYRDFIEQWVHEIKVPMTGIQLLCENNRSDVIRKIMSQTEQIEREVERVLFLQGWGVWKRIILSGKSLLRIVSLRRLPQTGSS